MSAQDNTEKILRKNKINHIQLIRNLGIGGAVQTGYKYAYEKLSKDFRNKYYETQEDSSTV